MSGARAAFLDRDGVLNERPAPHTYVTSRGHLRLLPGIGAAVTRLGAAGWVPIVVSNQRGIARGLVARETLAAIEDEIQAELAHHGTAIAGFFYCPHDHAERCDCRKPAPGLLLRAAEAHGIDLARSAMIGDSESDVLAGQAAGCTTVLITETPDVTAADRVAPDLAAAVDLLLAGP